MRVDSTFFFELTLCVNQSAHKLIVLAFSVFSFTQVHVVSVVFYLDEKGFIISFMKFKHHICCESWRVNTVQTCDWSILPFLNKTVSACQIENRNQGMKI